MNKIILTLLLIAINSMCAGCMKREVKPSKNEVQKIASQPLVIKDQGSSIGKVPEVKSLDIHLFKDKYTPKEGLEKTNIAKESRQEVIIKDSVNNNNFVKIEDNEALSTHLRRQAKAKENALKVQHSINKAIEALNRRQGKYYTPPPFPEGW